MDILAQLRVTKTDSKNRSCMQLNQIIPLIYKNILSTQVLKLDVTETKATCHDCLRSRDKRFAFTYKSDLKCCTFHPYLPNFAVGGLLLQNLETPGLLALKNKIIQHEFNFPIGLIAPYEYQFRFLSKDETDFGNDKSLLCPYYDKIKNDEIAPTFD